MCVGKGGGWHKKNIKKSTSYFVFYLKGVTRLTLALTFMCVLDSKGICGGRRQRYFGGGREGVQKTV